jgi:hypothetical protein
LSGERNPACESVILLFEANGGVMRQKLLLRQSRSSLALPHKC